jgi:CRP-like cAMP-binding protein
MSEKLWHLKRCNLFQQLTPEQLRRVELHSRARSFPRRTPIYLPADQADAVFLLTDGRAKICHLTPDGKQSILAFVEPGELFGELAILEPGRREEYAETIEDSTVVLIPGEEVQRLMREHPDVSLGVTKMIGLRRRRVEQRLKNLLFLSNRDRLTHLLLELAEQYGRRTKDAVELSIRLSHQDLANVIGSTRETVTVVLGEMQLDGLIRVGRRKIAILDTNRLAQSVQREPPPIVRVSDQPAAAHGST